MLVATKIAKQSLATSMDNKNKANKAGILVGDATDEQEHCCVRKTCADFNCTAVGRVPLATFIYSWAKNTAPTHEKCCAPITKKCAGNTASDENIAAQCINGYKDKPNKASIAIPDDATDKQAVCCDQKTCADFNCAAVRMTPLSSDTYDWAAGTAPTKEKCCAAITKKCAGNTDNTENIAAACTSNGYKDKANKASIDIPDDTTDKEAVCCDRKSCEDYNCTAGRRTPLGTPTYDWAKDTAPTHQKCCAAITKKCAGNTDNSENIAARCTGSYIDKADKATIDVPDGTTDIQSVCCSFRIGTCMHHTAKDTPFSCPDGQYPRDLPQTRAARAFRAAKKCVNVNHAENVTQILCLAAIENHVCPTVACVNAITGGGGGSGDGGSGGKSTADSAQRCEGKLESIILSLTLVSLLLNSIWTP